MTVLDILVKASAAMAELKAILNAAKAAVPDLAGKVDPILALLDEPVSQANLVALAEALPAEIANIATGHLDPRFHPGDAV